MAWKVETVADTIVRIRKAGAFEIVLEVPPLFGDAAGVARRLRGEGYKARSSKGEVIVEAT